MTLREVQQTINEFRDGGWAAIVRTRNHLLETLSVTGLAPYIGLCLAMTVNTQARGSTSNRTQSLAPPCSIWSVQIVSLFNRLSAESNTQDDMKDHGLTSARLMLTPIIAGLAAVGGVFLTSLLANGVAGAVSGTGSAAGVPDIGTIYNVSVKPFGLLLAAVLGLSPNMLIGALQDQAGGVKGIGLAGALSVVDARGYQPHNVAGTSAGAITASLVAAGYTAAEIKQIIFDLNFKDFMDQDFLGRLPLLGAAWH